MNEQIKQSISRAVDELIENSINKNKLKNMYKKHYQKVHFIPVKYRVLGGILQSMNIQFGNFLEKTIKNIIEILPNNQIIKEYSGLKSNKFKLSKKTIILIDEYIMSCQINSYSENELKDNYLNLLKQIIKNENEENETEIFTQDIDLLFKQINKNRFVYVEIKYNDDHDTGKFIDINRKFLKTIALLIRELSIKNISEIKPVLMYFNNKKMKGNIYIPEDLAIYRGKKFFEKFSNVSYEEIDECFKSISENDLINNKFENLYNMIINNKVIQKI